MSRIEEALRRAAQQPVIPESSGTRLEALDQFAARDTIDTASGNDPASPAVDRRVVTVSGAAAVERRVEVEPRELVAPRQSESRGEEETRSQFAAIADGTAGDEPSLGAASHSRFNVTVAGRLVVGDDVKPTTVEQYRRLAAALHQAQSANKVKLAMVASAVPGEGKTLTAVNLALTLSESYGRRVLLIDADLRRPSIHKVFDVPNRLGLNEALRAGEERKVTLFQVSPQLSLLVAGRSNLDPMNGLTSGRMQRILDDAAAKFDWVVIDTAPIGLITDAHLLAEMVHIVILVVHANLTPCALVQQAVESLGRDRIIGVVLNWVDERAASPGGKYGEYYSGYLSHDRHASGAATDKAIG
jgi:capsular exopolysaccharide synthesis family protein